MHNRRRLSSATLSGPAVQEFNFRYQNEKACCLIGAEFLSHIPAFRGHVVHVQCLLPDVSYGALAAAPRQIFRRTCVENTCAPETGRREAHRLLAAAADASMFLTRLRFLGVIVLTGSGTKEKHRAASSDVNEACSYLYSYHYSGSMSLLVFMCVSTVIFRPSSLGV